MNLNRQSSKKTKSVRRFRQSESVRILSQSGQIIVEYVLLLVIAVAAATIITKGLIGQDGGAVITGWQKLIDQVAHDKADDIKR